MSCEFYDLFCFFDWLVIELQLLGDAFLQSIMSGFASLIEAIPAPEFLLNASALSLPSNVLDFGCLLINVKKK